MALKLKFNIMLQSINALMQNFSKSCANTLFNKCIKISLHVNRILELKKNIVH